MIDNPNQLDKWLAKLLEAHPKQIALGLKRVRSVAERLNLRILDRQIRLSSTVIVVGGTNGKGSVCAFLENILLSAGYTTTLYTSPHILTFKERLRSNGEVLDDSEWIKAFNTVENARVSKPIEELTFFEFSTLAAILISDMLNPDVAIFEIGLGGRLDAVNLLDSDCAVLTTVDLDHEGFLGKTREKIAWEKVHIARSGKPIVLAEENPPEILYSFCKDIGAKQIRVNRDYSYKQLGNQWSWRGQEATRHALSMPSLRGNHQIRNASAALACVEALSKQFPISQGSIRKALISVQLPGRLQVLAGQPTIILDVAHNASAARVLSSGLGQLGFYPLTIGVVGLLDDKDSASIFKILQSKIDRWFLVSLDAKKSMNRGRRADSLKKTLMKVIPKAEVCCFDTPEEGFTEASKICEKEDRIVVCGSFVTVSAVWGLAERFLRGTKKGE
tara:strand:+ start:106 stop:1443 length:1338 start_codon:yes stop_codon:yes gene_type:complete